MAAVVMVVVLMMLNLIIIGVVVSGSRDHGLTTRRIETVKAFYAAEAGLNMAFREVLQNADEDGDGLVGSVSDDGDAANDPSVGDGRVMVTNAFASGRTTLSSSGRAGDARREIEAIIRD